jgi:bis(5'-nucleosyl)-tetraphosphatase (symmetrical)
VATYAIGDVQGCFQTLAKLLDVIGFDRSKDELWFAGDLVNRGPRSLAVLRFAREHDDVVKVVLGNHDLHFLGRVAGVRRAGRRDTLEELLAAPDIDDLADWLRKKPLVIREGDRMMVHAGLLPSWTADDAEMRSKEIEALLVGDDWKSTVGSIWSKSKRSIRHSRNQETVAVMTLLRVLDPDLRPSYEFKRAPEQAPPGYVPWYEAPGRRTTKQIILFGHWAALGHRMRDHVIALDSGCVWGNTLTAVRLEDREVFQVPNAEQPV